MGSPRLRMTQVELVEVQLGGIGVAIGMGPASVTHVTPGDNGQQPQMNPTAIVFNSCMVTNDNIATGRCIFSILSIPFVDPLHPKEVHVNMQFGEPGNMVVAGISIADYRRVIESMQATLELAELENGIRTNQG